MAPRRKPRYERWNGLTGDMIRVAKDRTAHLLDSHPLSVQSYQDAIANAYLCGIADAASALEGPQEAASPTPPPPGAAPKQGETT